MIGNWMIRYWILVLCFVLAGCGFHPVYGVNKYQDTGVEQYLGQIDIGNIPNREGQYLRNALIDRFYRNSRPLNARYSLSFEPLIESITDLDITKTSDSTRAQLRETTAFTLKDVQTGEILMQRDLYAIVSYNILASEFSSRVSEDSARLNAIDDLAQQVEKQISLYFKRQTTTAP